MPWDQGLREASGNLYFTGGCFFCTCSQFAGFLIFTFQQEDRSEVTKFPRNQGRKILWHIMIDKIYSNLRDIKK